MLGIDITNFSHIIPWLSSHGYGIFALLAFFEGPFVTAAAGVVSSFGIFSPLAIILISIAGDIGGDLFFFALGYVARDRVIGKYGHYVGLTPSRLVYFENLFIKYPRLSIAIVKFSPLIPIPGIMAMGASRMNLFIYAQTALLIAIPRTLVLFLLGYTSGSAYNALSQKVSNSLQLMWIIPFLLIVGFYCYQQIMKKVEKKMEEFANEE